MGLVCRLCDCSTQTKAPSTCYGLSFCHFLLYVHPLCTSQLQSCSCVVALQVLPRLVSLLPSCAWPQSTKNRRRSEVEPSWANLQQRVTKAVALGSHWPLPPASWFFGATFQLWVWVRRENSVPRLKPLTCSCIACTQSVDLLVFQNVNVFENVAAVGHMRQLTDGPVGGTLKTVHICLQRHPHQPALRFVIKILFSTHLNPTNLHIYSGCGHPGVSALRWDSCSRLNSSGLFGRKSWRAFSPWFINI